MYFLFCFTSAKALGIYLFDVIYYVVIWLCSPLMPNNCLADIL